jgi:hypothetical protein
MDFPTRVNAISKELEHRRYALEETTADYADGADRRRTAGDFSSLRFESLAVASRPLQPLSEIRNFFVRLTDSVRQGWSLAA